jgi:hypothetical protein
MGWMRTKLARAACTQALIWVEVVARTPPGRKTGRLAKLIILIIEAPLAGPLMV